MSKNESKLAKTDKKLAIDNISGNRKKENLNENRQFRILNDNGNLPLK